MIEQQPQGHKYTHTQRIYLDQYNGIASDLMAINEPASDGLMRVADIRRDVAVVRRIDPSKPKTDITQEGRFWYIRVNDAEIGRRVSEHSDSRHGFEADFTKAFKKEVNSGIKQVLVAEKILNGGEYNVGFVCAAFLDSVVLVGNTGALMMSPESQPTILGASLLLRAQQGFFINAVFMGHDIFLDKTKINPNKMPRALRFPTKEQPIMRSSIAEAFGGPLPIDRLARGLFYLNRHGNKLIDTPDELKP